MLVLSVALVVALFSAAAAQEGRIWLAAATTIIALGLAAWVAVAIVPVFAHRVVVSSRYVSTQKKSEQAEAILREILDTTRVPM